MVELELLQRRQRPVALLLERKALRRRLGEGLLPAPAEERPGDEEHRRNRQLCADDERGDENG